MQSDPNAPILVTKPIFLELREEDWTERKGKESEKGFAVMDIFHFDGEMFVGVLESPFYCEVKNENEDLLGLYIAALGEDWRDKSEDGTWWNITSPLRL